MGSGNIHNTNKNSILSSDQLTGYIQALLTALVYLRSSFNNPFLPAGINSFSARKQPQCFVCAG